MRSLDQFRDNPFELEIPCMNSFALSRLDVNAWLSGVSRQPPDATSYCKPAMLTVRGRFLVPDAVFQGSACAGNKKRLWGRCNGDGASEFGGDERRWYRSYFEPATAGHPTFQLIELSSVPRLRRRQLLRIGTEGAHHPIREMEDSNRRDNLR